MGFKMTTELTIFCLFISVNWQNVAFKNVINCVLNPFMSICLLKM